MIGRHIDPSTSAAKRKADDPGACVRLYSEQEWIDWLLGSLAAVKRSEMAAHLTSCEVCLEHKRRWEEILDIRGGGQDAAYKTKEPAFALAYAGEDYGLPAKVPSDSIRRKLRLRVQMTGWRLGVSRFFAHRWKWTVSFAAVLMVLIGMGVGIGRLTQPDAKWDRYVQTYEPEALPVMSKPGTISYQIDMGRLEPDGGMVWYNADSREMLMLVGGLVPDKNQLVRVWIVKEGMRDSLGLLQYHANRAHLYVKDKTLSDADNLELTIEPAGGAPEGKPLLHTISLDLLGR